MALDIKKLGISGAIAGVATGVLLGKVVMPVLNFVGNWVPQLSLKLANPATLEVNIRQSLTGINAGLGTWFANILGLTLPETPYMPYVWAAVGGAALFIAGAYLADALKMLEGSAVKKTATVIFLGSALAVVVLAGFKIPSINWALANTVIAMAINAGILAWLYSLIDPKGSIGLLPF